MLEAWQGGDLAAGEELFERYYEAIFRFFANKVSDGVSDLVQQTFMACVEGRDRLRRTSSFRSYLFSIAHNKFRAHLRARYRDAAAGDLDTVSLQDLAPGPRSLYVRRREQRILLDALRTIPIAHQVLIELRYWEQLKTVDIAEILNLPHGTVRSRLRIANDLLKKAIQRLAASPHESESTINGLDEWARLCRDHAFRD
ncbi:MAG: sigma-70 family RNA polymerase sigma factor [Proteobacteria bacterium]|nr:sigma-70 family RNA polymerase sigma factor [Pseudomonadota bacterium]